MNYCLKTYIVTKHLIFITKTIAIRVPQYLTKTVVGITFTLCVKRKSKSSHGSCKPFIFMERSPAFWAECSQLCAKLVSRVPSAFEPPLTPWPMTSYHGADVIDGTTTNLRPALIDFEVTIMRLYGGLG